MTRRSARRTLGLLAVVVPLAASILPSLVPLQKWALVALAGVAALVQVLPGRWFTVRKAGLGKPTPIATQERANLLSRLRDQAESEIARNLGWLTQRDKAGPHESSLPYRIAGSRPATSGRNEDERAGTLELTVDGLMSTLAEEHGLLVVGAGGSGKTTLLRLVQIRLLDAADTDPNSPIPVFLPVQNWGEQESFEDYLRRELDVAAGVIAHWVRFGSEIALLLDGLDELNPPQLREEFVVALGGYLEKSNAIAVVTSRPEEPEGLSASPELLVRVELATPETAQVREVLAECWGQDPPDAVVDFADSWQKVSLLVESFKDAQSADELIAEGRVDLDALLTAYVRTRCIAGPPVSYERRIAPHEVRCLEWVAKGLHGDGQTYVTPDAIPYRWAPHRIQVAVTVGLPALGGLLAGGITALWLSPAQAAVVTCGVWLSFTTDDIEWYGRSPRRVLVASVLAAAVAFGLLTWAAPALVLVGIAGLALWIYYTGHYAPKYVVAAVFSTSLAAWGANGVAGHIGHPIVAGIAATVSWFFLLPLAATFLFIPCGNSVTHYRMIEDKDTNGPAWTFGADYGLRAALLAAILFIIPTLAVCLVAALLNTDAGLGVSILVSPACTWFMVWFLMENQLNMIDSGLPASIRVPLIISMPVPVLVVLAGGGAAEGTLAQPLALLSYLGLSFVRGTDTGVVRRREGGALLSQPIYYGLLVANRTIPGRFSELLELASRRLILKPTGNGSYSFEHSLIRDHLARTASGTEAG